MKAEGLGEIKLLGLLELNPEGFGGLTPGGLNGRATGGTALGSLRLFPAGFAALESGIDLCTVSFSIMMLVVSDGLAKAGALFVI